MVIQIKKTTDNFNRIIFTLFLGILMIPFQARADGGSSFASAVAISASAEYTSNIAAAETEYFSMDMTAGYSYLIYSYSQSGVDMHFYICNSSQVELAGSGWQNVNNASLGNGLVFNCPSSGSYYLKINSHNNTQTGTVTFRTRFQTSTSSSIHLGTCTFTNTVYNGTMTVSGSIYNGWEVDFGVGQGFQFIDIYINETKAVNGLTGTDVDILKTSTTNFSYTVPLTSANGATSGSNTVVVKACVMNPYYAYTNDEDTYMIGSPVPADPTSITPSGNPICHGSPVTLTANGVEGTVYWYTTSCGGTVTSPPTGNTLTISPSVSTTYFARNYNNSQFSSGCASITIIVTPSSEGGIAKW
jgi:hypothetical protein